MSSASILDLPQTLSGRCANVSFVDLKPGMCYEIVHNGIAIRRGIILHEPSSTSTFAFYPTQFTSKIVRGEVPTGHSFFEGVPLTKIDQLTLRPLGVVYEPFLKTIPYAVKALFSNGTAGKPSRTEVPKHTVGADSSTAQVPAPTTGYDVDLPRKKRLKPTLEMDVKHQFVVPEPATGPVWGPDIEVMESELPVEVPPDLVFRKPREPRAVKAPMAPMHTAPVTLPNEQLTSLQTSLEATSKALHGLHQGVASIFKALKSLPDVV